VIGFGTGLETTQVGATLSEFVKLAWNSCIIPMQNAFAGEIKRSLLVDYEFFPENFSVEFDRSRIAALQDNVNELFTRANIGLSGGWLTVAQAKRMVNIEPDADDDVYLRSPNIVEVPIGMTTIEAQTQAAEISSWAMNYSKSYAPSPRQRPPRLVK
jgi:hypothetical protein